MFETLPNFLYDLGSWVLAFLGVGALGYVAWIFWRDYVRMDFISGMDFVLLEIIPPRDVLRSPKAMELFFTNALYHKSGKGLLEAYWQGAVWFWFSLEIASIEGQVHFYIRIPTRIRGLVETQLYAQYPQAQVKEVEDYTLAVDEVSPESDWNLWGCEFTLEKHDAYPIKTYVDFGLDKDPDEEYKVDPISPIVELFGGVIGKGEQMWLQIVVMASNKKYPTPGTWFGEHEWVEEAQRKLFEIAEPYTSQKEKAEGLLLIRPPSFVEPQTKGIAEKIQKVGFDCGIRACYVAKKEYWKEDRRRDIRLIFRQYSKPYLNSFARINSTQFDYPWHFTKRSLLKLKNRTLHEYRERSFFWLPFWHHFHIPFPISIIFPAFFHHKIFVLNSEELATIWHFPGQILKVPTLERIESKEASPPTNLPT